ncbi:hypothetical protein EDC35_101570 [Thiobaca trueperi]|uniref:Uncharacterized protein n=2 Tax=Thiobaca trueperi TaxID=127458 RepID=A0A4R3N4Z0_9GAMM|nr:hypothetical protein EDC35_101570 [Thiobaca trueperi]
MIHAPSVIRHLAVAATGILAMVWLTGSWLVPAFWAASSISDYLDWYQWARVSGCLNPLISTLSAIREQAPLVWGVSFGLGLAGLVLQRAAYRLRGRSCVLTVPWFLLAFPVCALVVWLIVIFYRP